MPACRDWFVVSLLSVFVDWYLMSACVCRLSIRLLVDSWLVCAARDMGLLYSRERKEVVRR